MTPFANCIVFLNSRKRKNQSQNSVQDPYTRYNASNAVGGGTGAANAADFNPLNSGTNPAMMGMQHDARQDSMMSQQYGQVIRVNRDRILILMCATFSNQHLHNAYPQSNYMGANQRLSGCPPNGSLNQCTSLNGSMPPNAINGSMHSMQCGSMHHSHNAGGGMGQMPNMGQDMGSMGMKNNGSMNSNAMYGGGATTVATNSRVRGSSANYSTANQQQPQQQQFAISQKRPTHQYPINNVNIPFNSNNPSSAPIGASSYSTATNQFNTNQVRSLSHYNRSVSLI